MVAGKDSPKISESRKIRKPLMEKKRRARINDCLEELKKLVLESKRRKGVGDCKPTKLEKADILELTVNHLRSLSHQDEKSTSYMEGFRDCSERVKSLIDECENLAPETKAKLLGHLFTSLSQQKMTVPVTLISTKLPNGRIALVLPSSVRHLTAVSQPYKAKHLCDSNRIIEMRPKQEMWRPW